MPNISFTYVPQPQPGNTNQISVLYTLDGIRNLFISPESIRASFGTHILPNLPRSYTHYIPRGNVREELRPELSLTATDYRKIFNLLALLRNQSTNPYNGSEVTIDTTQSSLIFGCRINHLQNALKKAVYFLNNFLPINNSGRRPMFMFERVTARRYSRGYSRAEVTQLRIRLHFGEQIISSLPEIQPITFRSRNNMPNQSVVGSIQVDNTAIYVDPTQDSQLNENYRRNIQSLIDQRDNSRYDSYPQELGQGTIRSYIQNAVATFPSPRTSTLPSSRRSVIQNGLEKMINVVCTQMQRNANNSNISTDTIDITNSSADWRRGLYHITGSETVFSQRANVGFRFKRSNIEEWFQVGSRGPNRNRERMGREIRNVVRDINLFLETFGCTLTTHMVERAASNNNNDDRDEETRKFRVFVFTNLPVYGTRWTNGISPVAIPSNEPRTEIPAFFRDPLIGITQGIVDIYNFLRGQAPILPAESTPSSQLTLDDVLEEYDPSHLTDEEAHEFEQTLNEWAEANPSDLEDFIEEDTIERAVSEVYEEIDAATALPADPMLCVTNEHIRSMIDGLTSQIQERVSADMAAQQDAIIIDSLAAPASSARTVPGSRSGESALTAANQRIMERMYRNREWSSVYNTTVDYDQMSAEEWDDIVLDDGGRRTRL